MGAARFSAASGPFERHNLKPRPGRAPAAATPVRSIAHAFAAPEREPLEPADLAVAVMTHRQFIRSLESNARLLHLRTDADTWHPGTRKEA